MLVALLSLVMGVALLPIFTFAQSCSSYYYKNYTASFDTLPTGSGPPDGYKTVDWHNWEVTDAVAISPHSKPAYIVATDSNLGYISQGNGKRDGGQIFFGLKSFYLGCSTDFGSGEVLPVGCTITVTTKTLTNVIPVQEYNFTYEPGRRHGHITFNMHKFETGLIFGQYMYFTLAAGLGGTSVFLDDVVLSQSTCMK